MSHRVFFDISGLVQWYAYLRNASGIQRVMESVLGVPHLARHPDVEFVARAIGSDRFYRIEPEVVCGLTDPQARHGSIARLRRLFGGSKRLASPLRLLAEMRSIHLPYVALGWGRLEVVWEAVNRGAWPNAPGMLRPATPPTRNDVIVSLGDFWCHGGHVDALVALRRQSGASLVLMIHDLVAIYHPQWTHPHYGREFAVQLERLAPHVDHWLTNSHYVRRQLEPYLQSRGLSAPAVEVLPMGWQRMPPTGSRPAGNDETVLGKYGLAPGRYFLHVGTVEPRKNVEALIDAATRLRAVLGERMPPCVLVGRDGWRSDAVRARLDDAQQKDGVRWLKKVDDGELAALYRQARFTVVPSHEEGWGLAVQESLVHGTPCIASAAGGLPEAGLDLALYVDVRQPGEIEQAIRSYITDEEAVATARRHIRSRLQDDGTLPSWADAARCVMSVARLDTAAERSLM